MRRSINILLFLTALIMVVRLIPMATLPLTDTTEARYGAIAQMMVERNDWVTPWFSPDKPFWGKPPLSFWAQALSMKYFGETAFAARLPSWLATLATLILLSRFAFHFYGRFAAALTALIYSSATLVFVASGAVMTDPFLTLGVTLALTGAALARKENSPWWRYAPFIGAAIGLLAKGPLALVLITTPYAAWWALDKNTRQQATALPWITGSLLTTLLSLPWYIAAELKTPGFLNYFIWGEHVLRFIEPGWSGDLYGNAHSKPKGTIWVEYLVATLPWSILALFYIGKALRQYSTSISNLLEDKRALYLWAWALTTPLFFTAAGNILWTYVLPAVGPLAILLGRRLAFSLSAPRPVSGTREDNRYAQASSIHSRRFAGVVISAMVIPLATLIATGMFTMDQLELRSENTLVAEAQLHTNDRLLFVNREPTFSARFYNRENVGSINVDDIQDYLDSHPAAWLVANKDTMIELQKYNTLQLKQIFKSHRYTLVQASLRSGV